METVWAKNLGSSPGTGKQSKIWFGRCSKWSFEKNNSKLIHDSI